MKEHVVSGNCSSFVTSLKIMKPSELSALLMKIIKAATVRRSRRRGNAIHKTANRIRLRYRTCTVRCSSENIERRRLWNRCECVRFENGSRDQIWRCGKICSVAQSLLPFAPSQQRTNERN